MTGVLLDTDTLSYYIDPESKFRHAVDAQMTACDRKLHMSVLTVYELALYDRARSIPSPGFTGLFSAIEVLNPPVAGAAVFAALKLALAVSRGAKLASLARHNIDIALAATAIVEGLILVSNDSLFRDLAAIEPRLIVEDWTQ